MNDRLQKIEQNTVQRGDYEKHHSELRQENKANLNEVKEDTRKSIDNLKDDMLEQFRQIREQIRNGRT